MSVLCFSGNPLMKKTALLQRRIPMARFSCFAVKLCTVIALGMGLLGGIANAQGNAPIAFTVLGPDGAVARVITSDAACPQITVDGKASAMNVRAAPDQDFP